MPEKGEDNHVTLRELIEAQFKTQEQHHDTLKEIMELRFSAQDKALVIALASMDGRMGILNEFKSTIETTLNVLRDQAGQFVTGKELEAAKDYLAKDIAQLKEDRAELRGKASQSSVMIAWIISGLGLLIGIAGLIAGMLK